jgi:hypothetical protein
MATYNVRISPTAGSVVLAEVIALAFLMVVIGFAIPQVAGQIAAG